MTQGRPSTDDIVIRPAGPPGEQGQDEPRGAASGTDAAPGQPEQGDRGDRSRDDDGRGDGYRGDDGRGDGSRGDDGSPTDAPVDVRSEDVRVDPVPMDAPPREDDAPDDRAGTRAPAGAPATGGQENAPLLDGGVAEEFLRRWSDVQARFVDDPRAAVLDGDSLVAELVQELAQRFSQHKRGLEEQWSRGEEPSTEELRLALQQYRSFFQRLLAT